MWMERNLPVWLLGLLDGPRYRLFGRCWARGCPAPGRCMVLHSPRQARRCYSTPLAVVLVEPGYADLIGEPVVPVSHAEPA
jgi:hypothetical protein